MPRHIFIQGDVNEKKILIFSILTLLFAGCISDPPDLYKYQPPKNYDDGFNIGTLNEVHIDSVIIEKAVNQIYAGRLKEVPSRLIFKDNKLVLEKYFKGHKYKWDGPGYQGEFVTWYKFMLHHIQSLTKSVTSTCIGIAIDKGFIKSVDQSIFDYLPEHQHCSFNLHL